MKTTHIILTDRKQQVWLVLISTSPFRDVASRLLFSLYTNDCSSVCSRDMTVI